MKIGIDARIFVNKNYTGIANSVHEDLVVWANEFPENEYYLLSSKPITLHFDLPDNWHVVDTPWLVNSSKLWSVFQMPKLIKQLGLDVFWGTNYSLPQKVKGVKYYVTIYDLALFKFKNIGARNNTIRLKLFAKSACRKANKVITISKATAKDVSDIFHIDNKKIVVSYCGGVRTKQQVISNEKVNPELCFDEPYFLFVSTIEPRKNVKTIVEAFEQFMDGSDTDYKLVLAGRKGWKSDDIYSAIESSKYSDRIILPGYISAADKEYLYNNAELFLYPSLYEGFGIPILEAMQYRLPVITSNVSSMPEVGGDAAIYVNDPMSTAELTMAIQNVVSMADEEKTVLRERMEKQIKKFSWEKNAREIMAIFTGKE